MKTIDAIIHAHPGFSGQKSDAIATTVASLAECEQVCRVCADACLAEEEVEKLRTCIRTNLDCAAICAVTARVLLVQYGENGAMGEAQLHACILACQQCADHCEMHGSDHEHCRICADCCRQCQQRCNLLLGELSSAGVVGED